MNGAHIGFYQGDVKKLVDDIKELKPTIFVSVPRLLNRVYDKVSECCNCRTQVYIVITVGDSWGVFFCPQEMAV